MQIGPVVWVSSPTYIHTEIGVYSSQCAWRSVELDNWTLVAKCIRL